MGPSETQHSSKDDLGAGSSSLAPEEKGLLRTHPNYAQLRGVAVFFGVFYGLVLAFLCMIPFAMGSSTVTPAHAGLFLFFACLPMAPTLYCWRRYAMESELLVTDRRTVFRRGGLRKGTVEIAHGADVRVFAGGFNIGIRGSSGHIMVWGLPDQGKVVALIGNLSRSAARRGQIPEAAAPSASPVPPPQIASREHALELIRGSEFALIADRLTSCLKHSIRIRTSQTEMGKLPLGASRMGGVPDLPRGTPWPGVGELYLTFVAQIRMADVTALDVENLLPKTGWLYFFGDASGEIPPSADSQYGWNWKVLYFDGVADGLERAEEPTLPVYAHGYHACRVEFRSEWTLPDFDVALPEECCRKVKIADGSSVLEAPKGYLKLRKALSSRRREARNRMFGNPEQAQGGVALEWVMHRAGVTFETPGWGHRLAEFEAQEPEWLLLLQVGTDDAPGWMWSDAGSLYFGIRREDLLARRFDQACCTMQCF